MSNTVIETKQGHHKHLRRVSKPFFPGSSPTPTVRHEQRYRSPKQMRALSHSHLGQGKCRQDDHPEESVQFNR